jgi:hypothetical protein
MCIERNIVIFVAILLVVIFVFMVYNKKTEDFGNVKGGPTVKVEVDTIMDGPGYENNNVDGVDQAVTGKVPADYYFLDDGANGKYSITSNLFSPSCCSDTNWPVPFHLKKDPYICGNKSEYTGSNIFGQTSFSNSGCACLTKDQGKFLYNRGGNGQEFF